MLGKQVLLKNRFRFQLHFIFKLIQSIFLFFVRQIMVNANAKSIMHTIRFRYSLLKEQQII